MKPQASMAVVGAGIAGLSVALAASRAGLRPTLIDRKPPNGDGSVLLLWPNGMKAAAALGIDADIAAAGTEVVRTEFKLWSGSRLWELEVEDFRKKYGRKAYLISRENLVGVLRGALAAFGSPPQVLGDCSGFRDLGSRVAPRFLAPVGLGAFDALIGCDGLNSAIRRQLRPQDGKPRSAYHSAWIGLSDVPEAAWDYEVGHTVTFLGHGLRFCASTMKETGVGAPRRVYWYATEPVSDLEDPAKALTAPKLADLFATVSAEVANLIRASIVNPKLTPLRFHIQDRIPVRTWTRGAVTLAGDAAHPSTPDLGQGACQALESAATLAKCFATSEDFGQAFRRYERRRFDRTARVTEMSRMTAIQSTTSGPFVESIREMGIRLLLPSITGAEFHSLFSYEP